MDTKEMCKNCGKKIYWSGNFKVYAHESLLDQKNCERPEPDMSSFRPAPQGTPEQTTIEQNLQKPCECCGGAIKTHWQGHICAAKKEKESTEVRDEKIARIVKEFRKEFEIDQFPDIILRDDIEKFITQTLTTLLNEE